MAPIAALDRLAGRLAGELAGRQQRINHAAAHEILRRLEDVVGNHVGGDLPLGLAHLRDEFLLRRDQRLDGLLAETEGREEIRLRQLIGRPLEHHDVGLVADVEDVDVALLELVVGGVGEELTADAADADGADGAGPGDIADHQGGRGAVGGEDVRMTSRPSALSRIAWTWTSLNQPFGKSGRMGR